MPTMIDSGYRKENSNRDKGCVSLTLGHFNPQRHCPVDMRIVVSESDERVTEGREEDG